MKVLITGAAGFVGHHVVDYLLRKTDWTLTLLDRLDVSGNLRRLAELDSFQSNRYRVRVVWHDLRAEMNDQVIRHVGAHDYILHFAASTHVDRSIADPLSFVYENVVGTCTLLEFARKAGCQKMIYFGTDEVFGAAPAGIAFKEWDRYRSGNPYAATKAGAEELCLAYHNTYGVPVVVTHSMNIFGERQNAEKFIPRCIAAALSGGEVPIFADPTLTKSGSRFYIHAQIVAEAVKFVLDRCFAAGEKYNIVGEREVDNLELALLIGRLVGRPLNYKMIDFHSSRPGHDLRYALDGSKMTALGWKPSMNFDESLRSVVDWTRTHADW